MLQSITKKKNGRKFNGFAYVTNFWLYGGAQDDLLTWILFKIELITDKSVHCASNDVEQNSQIQ